MPVRLTDLSAEDRTRLEEIRRGPVADFRATFRLWIQALAVAPILFSGILGTIMVLLGSDPASAYGFVWVFFVAFDALALIVTAGREQARRRDVARACAIALAGNSAVEIALNPVRYAVYKDNHRSVYRLSGEAVTLALRGPLPDAWQPREPEKRHALGPFPQSIRLRLSLPPVALLSATADWEAGETMIASWLDSDLGFGQDPAILALLHVDGRYVARREDLVST